MHCYRRRVALVICLSYVAAVATNATILMTVPTWNATVPVLAINCWILVHQNFFGGAVVFNQTWTGYRNGFGAVDGKYWFGLEPLYLLTTNGGVGTTRYHLRVEIFATAINKWLSAEYSSFYIDSESANYKLHVSGYSGDAGDAFNVGTFASRIINKMKFYTPDRNNSCASSNDCGWWFNSCGTAILSFAAQGSWGTLTIYGISPNYYVGHSRMMIRLT